MVAFLPIVCSVNIVNKHLGNRRSSSDYSVEQCTLHLRCGVQSCIRSLVAETAVDAAAAACMGYAKVKTRARVDIWPSLHERREHAAGEKPPVVRLQRNGRVPFGAARARWHAELRKVVIEPNVQCLDFGGKQLEVCSKQGI